MMRNKLLLNLVCKLYSILTNTVIVGVTDLFAEEGVLGTEERLILRRILDFFYLRSAFLQSCFNYQMNYLQYTRLASTLMENPSLSKETDSNRNNSDNSNTTLSSASRKVAVLVHGAFQSQETFAAGGRSSLRWHLREQGYELWDLSTDGLRSTGMEQAAGPGTGSAQTPAASLRDVYQRIHAEHRDRVLRSITWIAHSTGCHDLLLARRRADAQEAAELTLSRGEVQEHLVLLSPVTSWLDEEAVQKKNANEAERRWRADRDVFAAHHCREVDAAISLLDAVDAISVSRLQQWRDLLSARTYSERLIAPLARLALGWRFQNISPARRAQLLPNLFLPASSVQLMQAKQLLCSLRQARGADRRGQVPGPSSLITGTVRLVWGCVAQVTGYLCARAMEAIGFAGQRDLNQQGSSKLAARVERLPPADGARRDARCRVTVFAGDADGLVNLDCLERNLSVYDTTLRIVSGYEHMDTIWADSAADVVFPTITADF
jgi:hypothetical protein